MHLLLAAGVQAVKVTNNPALHVRVVNSSVPVNVQNWPGTDLVAWLTLWAAVLTLAGVGFQIWLANRQIGLAREELKAVKDDLTISKDNWELINRAPRLAARFEVRQPYEASVSTDAHGHRRVTYSTPRLTAVVANTVEGKRRCDAFYIEIIIPVEALSLPEQARLATEPHQGYIMRSQAVHNVTLFPGGGPAEVHFDLNLDYAAHATEFELQYRMQDDFNDYPTDGYLKATIQVPTRPQHVFVNPRDEAEARMMAILNAGHPPGDDSSWFDKYTHAFELLDVSGFKTPDERIKAAEEIANRIRNES